MADKRKSKNWSNISVDWSDGNYIVPGSYRFEYLFGADAHSNGTGEDG
jgi:hypothetical protein